jgi:hypothetical protein
MTSSLPRRQRNQRPVWRRKARESDQAHRACRLRRPLHSIGRDHNWSKMRWQLAKSDLQYIAHKSCWSSPRVRRSIDRKYRPCTRIDLLKPRSSQNRTLGTLRLKQPRSWRSQCRGDRADTHFAEKWADISRWRTAYRHCCPSVQPCQDRTPCNTQVTTHQLCCSPYRRDMLCTLRSTSHPP